MRRLSCSIFLVLLILGGCQNGTTVAPDKKDSAVDTLEKYFERGPVKLTVQVTPKQPRLSDLVSLDLTIEAAPGVEFKAPTFGQSVGEFLVRDYREINGNAALAADKAGSKRQVHYQLEPTHDGKHLIRSLVIEFLDKRPGQPAKSEPVTLESDPIEINVTSELGDKTPSLTDLAGMRDPLPLPPRHVTLWIALALVLFTGAAGTAVWLRRNKGSSAAAVRQRSPEEIARDELNELIAENLHGQGQYKEFYVRLTGVVRRYIERTTGIRAPEQTTEEFLRDMKARNVFPAERSVRLAQFLEAADMVKYAAMEPGTRQIEESIARAQEFVGLPSALKPLEVAATA